MDLSILDSSFRTYLDTCGGKRIDHIEVGILAWGALNPCQHSKDTEECSFHSVLYTISGSMMTCDRDSNRRVLTQNLWST